MHILISGITFTGKSTLAAELSRIYKARGFGVLVLDSTMGSGWHADLVTDDPHEFLVEYWQRERCMCFLDESGDEVGHYNKPMIRTATKGRHRGHVNHYLTQRPQQIHPTVRNQCSELYMFCTAVDDCKMLSREFNAPELLEHGPNLATGEYIHARKMRGVSIHKRGDSNVSSDGSSGSGNRGNRTSAPRSEEVEEGGGSSGDPDGPDEAGRD